MFTGIVEEKGIVRRIHQVSMHAVQLTIASKIVIGDVQIGDSIAVNGICLTVTDFNASSFQVDAMPETLKATTLHELRTGSSVNLERAMAANGRFGGHFVSGHVDGVGEIIAKYRKENAIYYEIKLQEELATFLMDKGSITVDGISLTLFAVNKATFTISLIPHTAAETILGSKGKGDIVNIECDMLAKYVQNMLKNEDRQQKSGINQAFLINNGFM